MGNKQSKNIMKKILFMVVWKGIKCFGINLTKKPLYPKLKVLYEFLTLKTIKNKKELKT